MTNWNTEYGVNDNSIPNQELRRIIAQYYAAGEVQDYDFQDTALMAQLIINVREIVNRRS